MYLQNVLTPPSFLGKEEMEGAQAETATHPILIRFSCLALHCFLNGLLSGWSHERSGLREHEVQHDSRTKFLGDESINRYQPCNTGWKGKAVVLMFMVNG